MEFPPSQPPGEWNAHSNWVMSSIWNILDRIQETVRDPVCSPRHHQHGNFVNWAWCVWDPTARDLRICTPGWSTAELVQETKVITLFKRNAHPLQTVPKTSQEEKKIMTSLFVLALATNPSTQKLILQITAPSRGFLCEQEYDLGQTAKKTPRCVTETLRLTSSHTMTRPGWGGGGRRWGLLKSTCMHHFLKLGWLSVRHLIATATWSTCNKRGNSGRKQKQDIVQSSGLKDSAGVPLTEIRGARGPCTTAEAAADTLARSWRSWKPPFLQKAPPGLVG